MSQGNATLDRLFITFQQALAGRYSIDRELGRGGMGVVYMAREVHLDRTVAIKLLPPERVGDLPGLLRRLQDDAQSLRKRYDDLQQALNDAGSAATTPAYADVRAVRDSIHAKLGDAIAAMETIRLNLLRLHAGSVTVESLTTHLGLAAEVSEEVERLIRGHDDVERLVKLPREAAITPV